MLKFEIFKFVEQLSFKWSRTELMQKNRASGFILHLNSKIEDLANEIELPLNIILNKFMINLKKNYRGRRLNIEFDFSNEEVHRFFYSHYSID